MRPWGFDRLTLAEISTLTRWAQWREDKHWELAAWMCANLMNATGNMKQAVTVDSLLGPGFRARQEAYARAMTAQEESG